MGKVGIGTTNPQIDLAIGDNDTGLRQQGDGKLAVYTDRQERLRVDKSGSVGIGTTTPQAKLDVRGSVHAGNSDIYFTETDHKHSTFGNKPGYAAIENAKDYDALMILGRSGTDKGRCVKLWDYLEVNGHLHVTGSLRVNDVPYGNRKNVQWDEKTKKFFQDNSSQKTKENITLLSDDFHRILLIQPKTYTRPGNTRLWEIGYIAEDFHELGLNKLVYYKDDGSPDAIHYDKISIYLIEVVKQLRTTMNEYKQRLDLLEKKSIQD